MRIFTITTLVLAAFSAYGQAMPTEPDTLGIDTMNIQEIQEIVVTGRLPYTRMKSGALVTKIAGSPLEKSGTALDALRKVPGIIRKGDDLEVIGRGKPIYYINGRKVYDNDELKRLLSDEIESIEVITNPGAAYDATVTSVVKIKTAKRQGDGFSFNVFGKSEQSLRTGKNDPEGQISVNYRHKNVDVFASAKEWVYRVNQWSDMQQITSDSKTATELYRYDGNIVHHWRGVGTHITGGINWQINDRHSIGAKDDYAVTTNVDTRDVLQMSKFDKGSLTETIDSYTRKWGDNPNNKLVNAYYNGTVGKLNIDLNVDMFFSHDNENQSTDEEDAVETRNIATITDAKSKMIAAKLVLSYPIWKGSLQVGTEESFVNRHNRSDITGTTLPSQRSKTDDRTCAGFIQYNVSLDNRTSFGAGLRYEHAYFDYSDALNHEEDLNRKYDNLFPSASVATRFGRVRLSLDYSSKTQRPSFWQLNSPVNYHNRYVVQQGNPKLKPSQEHTVSLTGNYSFLTAGVNYTQYKDLVCNWSEPIGNDGMILVSYKNIDRPQRQVGLFVVANKTFGWFVPSWTFAYNRQWLTLDFDNGSRSFNKPMWVFNAFNAARLKRGWQLELNSEFHSRSNYSNVELTNNYWALETAVQKTMLPNNALTIRLAWQDMLRRGNNDVFVDYGSYIIRQTNTMDFNRVILTVRYSFNAARSKYKGTGAGKDAISRIGSTAK